MSWSQGVTDSQTVLSGDAQHIKKSSINPAFKILKIAQKILFVNSLVHAVVIKITIHIGKSI